MADQIDKIINNADPDKPVKNEEFNLNELVFHNTYFYRIPTQSNIYSFITLRNDDDKACFLTPSFHDKLFCFKYDDSHTIDEIQIRTEFTIGTTAIISMDAFIKSETGYHTLGITFIKKSGADSSENYLNIYSDWNDYIVEDDDVIDTPYCSLKINFIPFFLGHTTLPNDDMEPVFLLSGNDYQLHCFKTTEEDLSMYEEYLEVNNIFPEFENLSDICLNFNIRYASNFTSRLSAVFGDKGNVSLFQIDLTDADVPRVTATKRLCFDFPAVCGQFFTSINHVPQPSFLGGEEEPDTRDSPAFHAIVATSLEGCRVIRNVFGERSSETILPQSENYDVVTCCLICDINFDGKNEILLGTYGQTVLIYSEKENGDYELSKILKVSYPVLSLAYEDYMGDAFHQLIVFTTFGVHVYSHDEQAISKLLLQRLTQICDRRYPSS